MSAAAGAVDFWSSFRVVMLLKMKNKYRFRYLDLDIDTVQITSHLKYIAF